VGAVRPVISSWWVFRARFKIATIALLGMLIGVLPTGAVTTAQADTNTPSRPKVQRERSVPGKTLAPRRSAVPKDEAINRWQGKPVRWPTGRANVRVRPEAEEPKRLGAVTGKTTVSAETPDATSPVPVTVSSIPRSTGNKSSSATAVGESLEVQVASQKAAAAVGIDGVLLSVAVPKASETGSDAATEATPFSGGQVRVKLDYAAYQQAFGADWGSRLTLVQLPDCALTTPDRSECRTAKPLATRNDSAADVLSAEISVAASAESQLVTLAAAAAPEGAGGNFAATSLAPSGSWMSGSSSGGFSWNYPVDSPAVPGGPEPDISLSYSSQAVDGRTASTNNQSSWIAEGWDWQPGFVERRYRSCGDDQSSGRNNATKTGDLCWDTWNAVLSLNGSSADLVRDDDTGTWKLADDDGSRLERKTGATNGAKDGEHWVLTTTDGTKYHFGLNKLPGAASQVTNSTLTVPVYGNHAGEPCYAKDFADSSCAQAWRWNLDYVEDPLGNAMSLWWDKDTNYYGANNKADPVKYDRAGVLKRIDYGLLSDSLFSAQPAGRVEFTTAERCLVTSSFDCAEAKRVKANASNWPDTPLDQACASGDKCTNKNSPSFWSTKRLTTITTKVLSGSSLLTADTYALDQSFPATGDGTSPALWLKSVTRTGYDAAGKKLAMPAVTFRGEQMDNRVDGLEGLQPYSRYRVFAVDNESGGTIGVSYSARDCSALSPKRLPSSPQSNSLRCYPQYWTPKGATAPILDWFHKYVVTEVREEDNAANSYSKVTSYEYLDGAAWAFDDGEFAAAKERTWSEFRGYERVRTRLGSASDQKTLSEHRFFRGMDGDRLPDGKRSVQIADSEGKKVDDLPQYQGQLREEITYTQDGGSIDATTVLSPWSRLTGSRAREGTTALRAYQVRPDVTETRKRIEGDEWRRTRESTTYDSYGLPEKVVDEGDLSTSEDNRCSTTTRARNTDSWLVDAETRELTVLGACGGDGQVVSDERSLYDGKGYGVAPTKGLVTEVQELNADGDGYLVVDTTRYDVHGREISSTDVNKKISTVSYEPPTGAQPLKVTTTNAKGHQEVTVLEPIRGLPTSAVDANGLREEMEYDPLGRLLKGWETDQVKGTDEPSSTFDYLIRRDGPTVITTRSLNDDGSYSVAYEMRDGLGRVRQTQDQAINGGRILSDIVYDSRGWIAKQNDGYFNSAAPSSVILNVGDNTVPSQTVFRYDGQGAVTEEIAYSLGEVKWKTSIARAGDSTTTIPPQGDTPRTEFTDGKGRLVKLREYTNSSRSEYLDTTYDYDALDQLRKVTNPKGQSWSYEYDGRGRQTSSSDPDTGKTTFEYDDADRMTTSTDARGSVLATTYDELDRPTSLREGSAGGSMRSEWIYDTVAKGQLSSAIRYDGTAQYKTEVTAYDKGYRPTSVRSVIPSVETGLAGTYTYGFTYSATGKLETTALPAVGGLSAERVISRYNADGLPSTLNGLAPYVTKTQYSAYGELLMSESGKVGAKVWSSYTYDEHTRRLLNTVTDRSTGRIDNVNYGYDLAGNVTKISRAPGADTPGGTAGTDVQCFTYDTLRRMTSAWTATDACAAAPSAKTVGGPQPYWHTYTFDKVGNREKLVEHDPAGAADKDTTRKYEYGTTSSGGGPNALKSVTSTGPAGERLNTYGYDKNGNTTSRQQAGSTQTLKWDAESELASVEEGGKTTSYLYDAGGERLIKRGPDGSRTLYLGEAEVTVNADGTVKNAERYYEHPDGSTTVRSLGGKLNVLLADHHGSAEVSVALNETGMPVTRRLTMPFGEERGARTGAWPGQRGFVGGTKDDDTGLTRLGARDYDPSTGRFISADPVMDLTNPQQMNPYAYSNNSPTTFSDPSGEFFPLVIGAAIIAARIAAAIAIRAAARRAAIEAARRAAAEAARRLALQKAREAAQRLAARKALALRQAAMRQAAAKRAAAAQAAKKAMARQAAARSKAIAARVKAAASRAAGKKAAAQRSAQKKARPSASKPKSAPKPKPQPKKQRRPADHNDRKDGGDADPCESNSFAPRTLVLLADGRRVRIDQVKVGDRVVATDARGRKSAQAVVATIIGKGSKDLVEITVRTVEVKPGSKAEVAAAGQSGSDSLSKIVATQGHPFWAPEVRRWVDAGDLQPGQWLRTSAGTWVQVEQVRAWTAQATVHNLTVDAVHTYHVLAGTAPVLVHNCGETYYRTMSEPDYKTLQSTGRVPATAETFVSPSRSFSEGYDGVLVKFKVRPGTTDALAGIGLRDSSRAARGRFGALPMVAKGWTRGRAYFKGEGDDLVNIGLGRGKALDTFNDAITGFTRLR
jgi:RHS repeat-associated protein